MCSAEALEITNACFAHYLLNIHKQDLASETSEPATAFLLKSSFCLQQQNKHDLKSFEPPGHPAATAG